MCGWGVGVGWGGQDLSSGKFKLFEFTVKFAKVGLAPPPANKLIPRTPPPPWIFLLYPRLFAIENRGIEGAGNATVICAYLYCYIYKYIIAFHAHDTLYR